MKKTTRSRFYELLESYYYLFSPVVRGRAKMDEAVTGALCSSLLHVGHAVIDAWTCQSLVEKKIGPINLQHG